MTGSIRATLTDGVMTHDAQIQLVEEKKAQFDAPGSNEFNFEDSWRFNVAAYRIDRMIGLNMVPVSIERSWRSKPAAFTWWIDDVMMDEGKRLKDKTQPADSGRWNEQLQLVRIFDQLIYNVDRNTGNMLIGNDWRVWAIDHTRAFRTHSTLKSAANITRCDRQLLGRLKELNRDALKKAAATSPTSRSTVCSRAATRSSSWSRRPDRGRFDRQWKITHRGSENRRRAILRCPLSAAAVHTVGAPVYTERGGSEEQYS